MFRTVVSLLVLLTLWSEVNTLNQPCHVYNQPVLCVNNNILRHTSTSVYEYFDGELIHVECWPLMLLGDLLFDSPESDMPVTYRTQLTSIEDNAVSMLVKLTEEHDGAMFYCRFQDRLLTISMKLGSSGIDDNHIQVNGIGLRPPRSAYYSNTNDEKLNVTFHSKTDLYKSMIVYNSSNFTYFRYNSNQPSTQIQLEKTSQGVHKFKVDVDIIKAGFTETASFRLDVISKNLCFDPYFTGLNINKIQAKYKAAENVNMIIYKLDYDEDHVTFGCNSQNPENVTVLLNGKRSNNITFELYTKNGTRAISGIINCTIYDNEVSEIKTTILNLIRTETPQQPYLIYFTGITWSTSLPSVQNDEIGASTNCKVSPDIGVVLTIIFVTVIVTIIIMVLVFMVYLKKCKRTPVHNCHGQTCQDDDDAEATTVTEPHIYEPVNYSTCKKGSEEPAVDIANRPQMPLPPEEREENKKYIHYDTPYEQRIFRLGMRHGGRRHPARRNHHNAPVS